MQPNFKPMLAASMPEVDEPYAQLRFPVSATPKLDGIRCVITDVVAVPNNVTPMTRSMKEIPNRAMRSLLCELPPYLDGEIMSTGTFQNCQTAVMSYKGEFDFKYHVFDVVPSDAMWKDWMKRGESDDGSINTAGRIPYIFRMDYLWRMKLPDWCVKVLPVTITSAAGLEVYERKCLADGHEGCMIRTPLSPYKYGRSTFREQWLVKIKQFVDDEATVIGYEEEMHNGNEATTDGLGYLVRTSHQDNLVGKGRLGALRVSHSRFGEFNIGSGFCAADREALWGDRDSLVGRIVTFKYQPQGMKNKPRIPIFKAFRDARDMSPAKQGTLL